MRTSEIVISPPRICQFNERTMIKPAATGIGRAAVASVITVLFFATASAIAEPLVIDVIEATPVYDARSGTPLVSFRMSENSKKAFADFSLLHVGKKIDIRVEGKTLNQPVIRETIRGGVLQILVASPDEAQQLANRLNHDSRLEIETSP